MTANTTILDRVRARFTGRAAESYALARVEESARSAKLLEQYGYYQQVVDIMADRFQDGWFPVGGFPGKNARQAGRNAPVLWVEPNLDEARSACRLLYDTNDYVTGLIDRLVDYTCGRGFNWTPYRQGEKPGGEADEIDPTLKSAQAALDSFRRRDRWRSRERELCKRGHRDGEAFLRLFRSAAGHPPAVRTIEPEWIAQPRCSPDTDGPWSWGVLTDPDDVEKPLAYHARDPNHPQQDGEVILAGGLLPEEDELARVLIDKYSPGLPIGVGRVYHYKCNVDRTTKRGFPTLAAAASGYRGAQKLLKNLVDTATLQAAIYLIRQHAGASTAAVQAFAVDFAQSGTKPTTNTPGSTGNLSARNVPTTTQTGPVVIDTTDQTTYSPGPATAGVPNFIAALQAVLRRGGVRVGAPEYLSSGDASNGNYASTKEAGSPFVVASEGRQMDLADFEEGVADGVLAATVPTDGIGFAGVCVAVVPPPVAIRSELDTENQRAVQHQNRVLSATTWQKQAGLKPEVEQANFAKEDEMQPDAGPPIQLPGMFGG